jgi:hypothetical protein
MGRDPRTRPTTPSIGGITPPQQSYPLIFWAALSGDVAVVRALIDHGADAKSAVDGWTSVMCAVLSQPSDQALICVKWLNEKCHVNLSSWGPRGECAISLVAQHLEIAGNDTILSYLIDNGAFNNELPERSMAQLGQHLLRHNSFIKFVPSLAKYV